jgi:hypothetical protein
MTDMKELPQFPMVDAWRSSCSTAAATTTSTAALAAATTAAIEAVDAVLDAFAILLLGSLNNFNFLVLNLQASSRTLAPSAVRGGPPITPLTMLPALLAGGSRGA